MFYPLQTQPETKPRHSILEALLFGKLQCINKAFVH